MAKFQIADEEARKDFVAGAGAGAKPQPQPPSESYDSNTVGQSDSNTNTARRASEMSVRSFRLTKSQYDWLLAQAGERMRAGEKADASMVLRDLIDRAMRHTV